jgi:hypothetical protein
MDKIHIVDNEIKNSLINMFNYGNITDVCMAIDILNSSDINDQITSDNIIEMLKKCPGLYMDTYGKNSDQITTVRFSYSGKRGEYSCIIVDSKSISSSIYLI